MKKENCDIDEILEPCQKHVTLQKDSFYVSGKKTKMFDLMRKECIDSNRKGSFKHYIDEGTPQF